MSIKPGPWLIILSFSMLGPAFLFAQRPHAHAKVYPPEMQMTSSPLRDIELLPDVGDLLEGIENPQRDYISGYGSEDIVKPGTQNRFDRTGGSDKVQTVNGLNFDGMGVSGRWPTPDANGAVGSTEFVQAVNAMFAVYDKSTGALLYGPVGFAKPWKALSGLCGTTGEGDPVVQYDKAAERWVFTKHAYNTGGPYYECVAVSTTPDALGSYNLYAYQLPNLFPDYPKLAVWPDAYYLSIDQQDPRNGYAYAGVLVCALDPSQHVGWCAGRCAVFPAFPKPRSQPASVRLRRLHATPARIAELLHESDRQRAERLAISRRLGGSIKFYLHWSGDSACHSF